MTLTPEQKEFNLVFKRMEEIHDKVSKLDHPADFSSVDIGLTEEERHFLEVFRTVAKAALFTDFNYIHHFMKNHHHVTLSVAHSRDFRENNNKVVPHDTITMTQGHQADDATQR